MVLCDVKKTKRVVCQTVTDAWWGIRVTDAWCQGWEVIESSQRRYYLSAGRREEEVTLEMTVGVPNRRSLVSVRYRKEVTVVGAWWAIVWGYQKRTNSFLHITQPCDNMLGLGPVLGWTSKRLSVLFIEHITCKVFCDQCCELEDKNGLMTLKVLQPYVEWGPRMSLPNSGLSQTLTQHFLFPCLTRSFKLVFIEIGTHVGMENVPLGKLIH